MFGSSWNISAKTLTREMLAMDGRGIGIVNVDGQKQ
jgi:hypothetical protein